MGEWLKKNGSKILGGGMIVTWFAGMGGAIASLIKSEKRQKTFYQNATKVQQEELAYWKKLNKKES